MNIKDENKSVSYRDYWFLTDIGEIKYIKMIAQVEFHPKYGEKHVSS